jgi:hypothetical protein
VACPPKSHEKDGVTVFHKNLIDYLVRRFLIPLHCSFAMKARTNPEFYFSLKVSLDAAMAILSREPDQRYARPMAVGGGLFREGVRCASTVISLGFISTLESQRLDGYLSRNSAYRGHLRKYLPP